MLQLKSGRYLVKPTPIWDTLKFGQHLFQPGEAAIEMVRFQTFGVNRILTETLIMSLWKVNDEATQGLMGSL